MTKFGKLPVKERILKTTDELFYSQGYHQTGINQIIEESGVAKATFYSHFKSKEDLGLEYLRAKKNHEMNATQDMVNGIKDPYKKYMAIIKGLIPFMEESNFRGCGFSNIAVEITEPKSPIRKEVKFHDEVFRSLIRDVVQELVYSHKRYKHLNVEEIVDMYYIITEGALIASRNYNDTWPLKKAVIALEKLVE